MSRPRGTSKFLIIDKNTLGIVTKHACFLIDKFDYEKVKKFKWHSKISNSTKKYYAYSHYKGSHKILLHRYLLDITDSKILVDHVNGDTINNKRSNLRIANRMQNNVNSKKRKNCKSKYKGLTLRPSGRWGVYINCQGKSYCLGTFDSEETAALVYNKKAIALFGEFAKLNIINKENNL